MTLSEHQDPFVHVRGAGQNNLQQIDVDVPRNALVVFTGVSGSGKSSLAFGTIYAEAQRRYFESVAPYVRRLIHQSAAPKVEEITGLPPAIGLMHPRGTPTARSTVGTVTTLSNLLRMLFSRAGTYPPGSAERLDSEAFSPNSAAGACPECHGLGRTHIVTEKSLVPDPSLSIRAGAITAWPGAWHGKNLRDVLAALGYDIERPWRDLPQRDRDWILFTNDQPVVTVDPVRDPGTVQGPYRGKYMSARRYVMRTLSDSKSPALRRRALRHVQSIDCRTCSGSGLRPEALAVTFGGHTIGELMAFPLTALVDVLRPVATLTHTATAWQSVGVGERTEIAASISQDLLRRNETLIDLGLGYLTLARPTPTLSPGELQRLRIATQLRAGLYGVVYVLDEPSAGLHPADAEPMLAILERLKRAGNSVFVVEHDMDIVRRADWVVDLGPGAGQHGGQVLYSGPVAGLKGVTRSVTRRYLFRAQDGSETERSRRRPSGWLHLRRVNRNNLRAIDVDIPIGVLTAVTGVSGSGKSSLVGQVLGSVVAQHLGQEAVAGSDDPAETDLIGLDASETAEVADLSMVGPGIYIFERLVQIDQKPIGRTPRSNLATYTGLFDFVRKAFATTEEAQTRGYTAGRFSFNVSQGRCSTCQGEGFVAVELLFLPSTYAPCPSCGGSRYNDETLEVRYRGRSIAEVLDLTVDDALDFLSDTPAVMKTLLTLQQVGLGYLRLGQPATELSGGEGQRIKLATELQRGGRQHTLYLLDEPTTGLHPADVERLSRHLHDLVDAGNTVVAVEHDLMVIAASDWVIDLGPGGGDTGGRVVASGVPADIVRTPGSHTAKYLAEFCEQQAPGFVSGGHRRSRNLGPGRATR